MKKGFTLIEILVAVAIFSLVISAASGIFISSLRTQRSALTTRTLLDETSYVIEYMSRAIRMAKKDIGGECISVKLNYEKTRGGKGLKFKNYDNICQEFFWDADTNQLKEVKGGEEQFLTSNNLEIALFNIKLAGESQDDDNQPRVTIFLDIKAKGQKPDIQPEIKIQTTISQRNLDVRY